MSGLVLYILLSDLPAFTPSCRIKFLCCTGSEPEGESMLASKSKDGENPPVTRFMGPQLSGAPNQAAHNPLRDWIWTGLPCLENVANLVEFWQLWMQASPFIEEKWQQQQLNGRIWITAAQYIRHHAVSLQVSEFNFIITCEELRKEKSWSVLEFFNYALIVGPAKYGNE